MMHLSIKISVALHDFCLRLSSFNFTYEHREASQLDLWAPDAHAHAAVGLVVTLNTLLPLSAIYY